jgi:hypothetical protein
MKIAAIVFFAVLLATIVMGCDISMDNNEPHSPIFSSQLEPDIRDTEDETKVDQESKEQVKKREPSIPPDLAAQYISIMETILDEDNGALWGVHLKAPFMFADETTREVVANQPDHDGILEKKGDVYVGILPEGLLISNSIIELSGERWGMVSWESWRYNESLSSMERSDLESYILRTMIHETFHARQHELMELPSGNYWEFFTDDMDTRIHIRLELNALLKALGSSSEEERLQAIHDALSIRERRRQSGLLTMFDLEYEIHEGMPRYTDLMLGYRCAGMRVAWLEEQIEELSIIRPIRYFSVYWSGAMYGLLLDQTGLDWKNNLYYGVDLGELLKDAAGIDELSSFDELLLETYGYTDIVAHESIPTGR